MTKVTNRGAVPYIGDMQDFSNAGGTFTGRRQIVDDVTFGELAGELCGLIMASLSIKYVVYSYSTPIAWALDDNTWVMPKDKYSVTTSKHQGLVRYAIARSDHRAVKEV